MKMKVVAPSVAYTGEIPTNRGKYWLLNLDMIEPNSGKIIGKTLVQREDIGTSTTKFSPKNVLYSKLRPYLNKVVIPDDYGFATTEMIPLLPREEFLVLSFLALLLRGDEFLSFIETQVSGTKMPRVQMKVFWDFNVILPPIELQNEFDAFYRQSDKSKFELEQTLSELNATYKRIIEENLG